VTQDNEIVLVGPDGEKYTRMIVRRPYLRFSYWVSDAHAHGLFPSFVLVQAQARYLKGVANGVAFDETIAEGFPLSAPISSLGPPTWTTKGPTWPERSVLYRLNDPLHIGKLPSFPFIHAF